MNFDIFNNIDWEEKEVLLKNCKATEKNVLIDPYNSIANARPALEFLCKGLLKRSNVKDKKAKNGKVNLYKMVEKCLDEDLFQGRYEAEVVRKNGNTVLHADETDESLHIVNEKNIAKAKMVAESLFILMQQAFDLYDVDFDMDKLPFGDYEVIRRVEKSDKEVVLGDHNYFVHNANGDYFYLQVYPKNALDEKEMLLAERSEVARSQIKSNKKRSRYIPKTQIAYDWQDESDRRFILYSVYEDSFLLSELKESMSAKQAIQVGLDLINVLLEMKRVGEGIHHRNIQPGSVILTPDEDVYMATLVNMETAKIQNYVQTIYPSLKDILRANVYLPREVRRNESGTLIDWEKADVYSVAKVMLYCVNPKLVTEEVDTDSLYDIFSDEMVCAFRNIFESTLQDSFNLEEFQEVLEGESE